MMIDKDHVQYYSQLIAIVENPAQNPPKIDQVSDLYFSARQEAKAKAHRQQKKTNTMRNPFARYSKEAFISMLERIDRSDTKGVEASNIRAQAII